MNQAIGWAGMGMIGGAASAGITSALGGGAIAGLAGVGLGAMAIPALMTAPITMAVEGELKRREFAANISTDLDLYRRKIGGNFTYQQTTALGKQLQRQMYRGEFTRPGEVGDFFNSNQQMQIMKTGLASGLLNTSNQDVGRMMTERGGLDDTVINAMRQSGTTQQFVKNFEKLRDTTKDIVKILNTTVTGGMSVIKELQQSGFTSIDAIRQQVIQAKGFGEITGVGSQNMMLIGRAGAQAVQGTSWSGASGATMYQQAATTAALQAQVSPIMARAVERAGGIAQAGATLAAGQMNLLNSGMGTRAVAAMLRSDGSIDPTMMDKMRSGGMSAYEITSRASGIGYSMGAGGRAMFDLTRQKALEAMSDQDRQALVQQTFNAWRANKVGNAQQQAWVFAERQMGITDLAQREMVMESLTRSKQYDRQYAALQAQRIGAAMPERTAYRNPISRYVGNRIVDIAQLGAEVGTGIVDYSNATIGQGIQNIGKMSRKLWEGAQDEMELIAHGGVPGQYINRMKNTDATTVLQNFLGVNARVSGNQLTAIAGMSTQRLLNLKKLSSIDNAEQNRLSITARKNIQTLNSENFQLLNKDLMAILGGTLSSDQLLRSTGRGGVLDRAGVLPGTDLLKRIQGDAEYRHSWANTYYKALQKVSGKTVLSGDMYSVEGAERAVKQTTAVMDAAISFNVKKDLATGVQRQERNTYLTMMDTSTGNAKKDAENRARLNSAIGSFGTGNIDEWITTNNQYVSNLLKVVNGGKLPSGAITLQTEGMDAVLKRIQAVKNKWNPALTAAANAQQDLLAVQAMNIYGVESANFANFFNKDQATGRYGKNVSAMTNKQIQIQTMLRAGQAKSPTDVNQMMVNEFGKDWDSSKDWKAMQLQMKAEGIPIDFGTTKESNIKAATEYLIGTKGAAGKTNAQTLQSKLQGQLLEAALKHGGRDYTYLDENKKEQKVNVQETRQMLQDLQLSTPSTIAGANASNTGQMNASVAPPILNYWNNRWTL